MIEQPALDALEMPRLTLMTVLEQSVIVAILIALATKKEMSV